MHDFSSKMIEQKWGILILHFHTAQAWIILGKYYES